MNPEQAPPMPPMPHEQEVPRQPETFDLPPPEAVTLPEAGEDVGRQGFFRSRIGGLAKAWDTAKSVLSKVGNLVYTPVEYGGKTYGFADSVRIRLSASKELVKPYEQKSPFDPKARMDAFGRAVHDLEASRQQKSANLSGARRRNPHEINEAGYSKAEMIKFVAYETLTLGPVRMIGAYVLHGASEVAVKVAPPESKTGELARKLNNRAKVRADQWDRLYTNPVVARRHGYRVGEVQQLRRQAVKKLDQGEDPTLDQFGLPTNSPRKYFR